MTQSKTQSGTDASQAKSLSGSESAGRGASAPGRRLLTEAQEADLRAAREQRSQTRRVTVPGLEEILYEPLPVLDHGFVRVVDYMGDDSSIVQAARVSYGKGTKKVSQDAGLINYLMRHRHLSLIHI